jgi:hypothetical protein
MILTKEQSFLSWKDAGLLLLASISGLRTAGLLRGWLRAYRTKALSDNVTRAMRANRKSEVLDDRVAQGMFATMQMQATSRELI